MPRRSIELSFYQDIYYAEFPLSETPYIATVEADDEYITICNPRSTELLLKDYYVVDSRKLHKFVFQKDEDKIEPHGTLYLYTCPKLSIEREVVFKEPHVLWRNLDGSLRRKEILNNGMLIQLNDIVTCMLLIMRSLRSLEHCEMLLYAPNHKCIASCSSDRSGKHEIKRREEELQSLPSLHLDVFSRTLISILRIVLLIAFAICAFEHHPYRIPLYWMAFLGDLFSRETKDDQESTTLKTLNRYGDDINLFILYITAIMHETAQGTPMEITGILRLFLILAGLLEFTAITAAANGHVLQSWRSQDEYVYAFLRHLHPALVTAVCLGSEVYLLSFTMWRYEDLVELQKEGSEELIVFGIVLVAFLLRQVSLLHSTSSALVTHL